MRRRIAERLSGVIEARVLVIDDVSFLKCGTASVGVARQYCGTLGKRANCQVAVSVHAATDTASCPLDWRLFLPREWTDDPARCHAAGVPEPVAHREKWRLALDMLDELASWGLAAPVIVADAGYGQVTPFRLALEKRGLDYVLAVTGKEVAQPESTRPFQPVYGGLGPPTLPRYRTRPRPLSELAAQAGPDAFTTVAWRAGSKGRMASRFGLFPVRVTGKQATAAAQEAGGGRSAWDGVLPSRTLLVEWPTGQPAPTSYWITDLSPVMFLAVLQWGRWPPGPALLCPPVDGMTWGVVSPGPGVFVGDADERSGHRPARRNAWQFAGGRSA